MSEASGKFLSIGMPGDDCCFCGPVIVKRSGEPVTDTQTPECSGHCTEPIPLYGDISGPSDFCFPYTCCPCPSGDTVTASLAVTSASGGFTKDIILSSSLSGLCEFGYPGMQCYATTGPYYGSKVPAEKYGVQNFSLCEPAAGCSGQKIDATLCCCDLTDVQGPTQGTGECHTCNYQFTISFLPFDPGTSQCFCPVPGLEGPIQLVPGDDDAGSGPKFINQRFELVDSTCDPFYLKYIAEEQYWNCDCLEAGDREEDNTVTLTVIITR
tara:strand:- start:1543 stop:2346 length:804 start_codon:yes stop_codon:yes gene_type:complete